MKNILTVMTVIVTIGLVSCKSSKNNEEEVTYYPKEERSRGGQPDLVDMFNQMDENKDGQLSKSEVKGPIEKDFDKIDLDNNGYLSIEELEKAPKPQRGGRGGRGGRNN